MSKSLGNFFTVRDLLDQGVPGEVIRFVMLSTHYRKPMDWTEKKERKARDELEGWYFLASRSNAATAPPETVLGALADDLNTSEAITQLRHLAKHGLVDQLKAGLILLGLLPDDGTIPSWAQAIVQATQRIAHGHALKALEKKLAELRISALVSKDFTEVDQLKAGLIAAGVEVRMSSGNSPTTSQIRKSEQITKGISERPYRFNGSLDSRLRGACPP